MKKIAILLASITLFLACSGSKEDPNGGGGGGSSTTPTITIGTGVNTSPVLGTEGGTVEIAFKASDAWTAGVINTRADSWVSVTPTNGGKGETKIYITAKTNDTPDERGATIQIKCGTATKNITLTQKQKDAFTATASKTELSKDGGSFTIEVKANVDFTYTIDKGSEWIAYKGTKALKTSTITFEAAKNDDVAKRDGQITVSSSAGKETFKIYQEGASASIILSSNTASVPDTGGSFQVDVTHNVDVTVSVQEGVTWLRESTTKATSTNTYVFVVDANETNDSREADVYFKNTANGLSETVHVVQAQKNAIVIANNNYEVAADGGSINVTVSHNVDFSVEISDSWITRPQNTKGMVTDVIAFAIEKNESGAERTGTITFKSGDLSQVVTVKQLYTAPEQDWTKPGFYGAGGINYVFDEQVDQIMMYQSGDYVTSGIIKPAANKIVSINFKNTSIAVGNTIEMWIIQNVDTSVAGYIVNLNLVISKIEGDFICAKDKTAEEKYIIFKYK